MTQLKTAIGLMSGTSMDGIDAALVKTDGEKQLDIIGHHQLAYSDSFRRRLKTGLAEAEGIGSAEERPGSLGQLEEVLTLYHICAVEQLMAQQGCKRGEIDLIGFHGQTLLHQPQRRLSVQIGDANLLAEKTGIDVVYNMRANDMRHGGEGAPLIPVYHAVLAEKLKRHCRLPIVFVNIGGLSNLTWIDEKGNLRAFDCGPGNCLIDQWIEAHTGCAYDRDGEAAARGKPVEAIIARYLNLPLFRREERRSFDWRDFPPLERPSATLEDGADSLAFITAKAIINTFKNLPEPPKTLIAGGGGVKNRAMMQILTALAAQEGVKVLTADDAGLNADFMEAEAWGYLAVRAFYNLPLTYPQTTGCDRPVSGGVLKKFKNNPCV